MIKQPSVRKRTNHILNRIQQKGLSLIEILIVMAITGATLLALLNLASRDLQIEKLNEEQDGANYIASSQLQELNQLFVQNPSCLTQLYTYYTSAPRVQDYYICHTANFAGQTPVALCTSPSQQWYLYAQTASNVHVNVSLSNNNYDCTGSQSLGYFYQSRLYVNSANASLIDLESDVDLHALNKDVQTISLRQQYKR